MNALLRRRGMKQRKQSILPSEYQRVEYIEFNGDGSYLNLGAYSSTLPGAILRFRVNKRAGSSTPIIATTRYTNNFLFAARSDVDFYTMINGKQTTGLGFTTVGTIYDCSVNADGNGTVRLNNTTRTAAVGTDTYVAVNFCVGTNNAFNQETYLDLFGEFVILDNMAVWKLLIPCYRKSDGEIGMYDTVSRTFYTNAGTGSFTKGADVN